LKVSRQIPASRGPAVHHLVGVPEWAENKNVNQMMIIQQKCEKLQLFFCGAFQGG
jgi:hypothetical protein